MTSLYSLVTQRNLVDPDYMSALDQIKIYNILNIKYNKIIYVVGAWLNWAGSGKMSINSCAKEVFRCFIVLNQSLQFK